MFIDNLWVWKNVKRFTTPPQNHTMEMTHPRHIIKDSERLNTGTEKCLCVCTITCAMYTEIVIEG